MSGYAEVLQQHVAGENVGRRHLFNRPTVVIQNRFPVFDRGIIQPQIKRRHTSLGVAVLNDDFVLIDFDGSHTGGHQFIQQSLIKTISLKAQIKNSWVSAMRPTRSWTLTNW